VGGAFGPNQAQQSKDKQNSGRSSDPLIVKPFDSCGAVAEDSPKAGVVQSQVLSNGGRADRVAHHVSVSWDRLDQRLDPR
jgi:hypothetical protein